MKALRGLDGLAARIAGCGRGDGSVRAVAIQSAYRADTYRRLSELKAKYDPTNFFKLNPNIKPAAR